MIIIPIVAGPEGWVCWGAKNSLVLLQDIDTSDYPRVFVHNDAHNDKTKVTAVAWCNTLDGVGKDKVSSHTVIVHRWSYLALFTFH